jgi:CDP-paratose 2-epimerase
MKNSLLVSGVAGLIGFEVARFFHSQGYHIHGIENNQRATFFGPEGDTNRTKQMLKETLPDLPSFMSSTSVIAGVFLIWLNGSNRPQLSMPPPNHPTILPPSFPLTISTSTPSER